MKRIALPMFLAGVLVLSIVSIVSWLRGDRDSAGPADRVAPVLAEGVELAATADARQRQTILALARAGADLVDGHAEITVDYPIDGSIFPPEMVAPTFLWHDDHEDVDRWLIDVALTGEARIYVLAEGDPPAKGKNDSRCFGATNEPFEPTAYQASARSWTPGEPVWSAIKDRSVDESAVVTILGYDSSNPDVVLSRGRMTLTTSADPVGAPIFYRDVPLMPDKNDEGIIKPLVPSALPLIEWRLKDISQPESRIVLTDMPTCANCHSFSADGATLAMDIDGPTGDKGAYAIAQIEPDMSITTDEIITWNSFPAKLKDHKTIGFLSRISPDGQYAMTTVNESLYVANFTDYRFLQVFYPTRGILAYYDRRTGEMKALPGADDTQYVHCDPVWSPDGRTIVFARARAIDPRVEKLPARANDPGELKIQYDLHRIDFNDGRGGRCERIEGASDNGMSNTFPKVSPDGKWIVFVKCHNGQLMRPDSRLWIVPVAGGEAREMTCNTPLMNSWHSFSPNGRWMVFSSKANTPYTQMFLTHIDEDGNDSPPILIPNATAANRAVNIPEFVKIDYDDLHSIRTPTVEYYRHLNAGVKLMEASPPRIHIAVEEFHKALAIEPTSTRINNRLAACMIYLRQPGQAVQYYEQTLETDPKNPMALANLGTILVDQGDADEAIGYYNRVLDTHPQYVLAHHGLARALYAKGRIDEAIEHLETALEVNPDFQGAREMLDGILELREQSVEERP